MRPCCISLHTIIWITFLFLFSKENNFNILGQLLIRPSLCAICAAEENPFKLSSEFVVERIFQQTRNLFNSIKCQQNIFVSNSNKQTIQINPPSGIRAFLPWRSFVTDLKLTPSHTFRVWSPPLAPIWGWWSVYPTWCRTWPGDYLIALILIVRWPLGPSGRVKNY